MNKMLIKLGFSLIVIIAFIEFILLLTVFSKDTYQNVTKDEDWYGYGLIYYDDDAIYWYLDREDIGISEEEAILIARKRIFDVFDIKLKKPYYLYDDHENNAYIIFAELKQGHIYNKVIIDKKTGGVLLDVVTR